MKFPMLVLALDTTTRNGSVAVLRGGTLLDCETGDGSRTHGERLPADFLRLLGRHRLTVQDVDLYAVAVGPGSFTGLRIGIAAMQGLALVNARPMAGISTLDALRVVGTRGRAAPFLATWMDAQRGELFSALYGVNGRVDGPSVGRPADILAQWTSLNLHDGVTFVGDGALAYEQVIHALLPGAAILSEVPPLAPAVGQLALAAAARGETVQPGDIRAVYVRRSDAELARDRRAVKPGDSARSEPTDSHSAAATAQPDPAWTIERSLSESDLDEIVAIEAAAFTNPWTRPMYLRELQNPDVSFLYVLRTDGRIAGFCAFWLVLDEVHINNLAVRAEWQGRGIGSALLQHALQAGASRGAERATLEVRRSNAPARRLYERLGFKVAATRPNYYVNPPEDALILWKGGLNCATFRP